MEGLGHDHEIPQHDHIVHDVHAGLVGVVGLDVGREHSGILREPWNGFSGGSYGGREGLDLAILWQASLCLAMSPTIPCQNTASADLSFMRSTPWCAACRRWRMEGLGPDQAIPQHVHIVHDVHSGLGF